MFKIVDVCLKKFTTNNTEVYYRVNFICQRTFINKYGGKHHLKNSSMLSMWVNPIYQVQFKSLYHSTDTSKMPLYWGISKKAAATLPFSKEQIQQHIAGMIIYAEQSGYRALEDMRDGGDDTDLTKLFLQMDIDFNIGEMSVDNLTFIYNVKTNLETDNNEAFMAVIERTEAEMYRNERAPRRAN